SRLVVPISCYDCRQVDPMLASEVGGASNRIGQVVERPRPVVYRVPAGSRYAALQAAYLLHQAVRFRQCDATTVQQWQHVAIEVAFDFIAAAIFDTALSIKFAREFAAIFVAAHEG